MPSVVIAADGNVGLEILRYLDENYQEDIVMCIVTPGSKVEAFANSRSFCVVPWTEENEVANQVRAIGADFGILAWWPYVLHEPLLAIPKQGWVNTHPSFLPYGRGKHFNFWTIVEEVPFGVSLHWVDSGLDNGDLIAQQQILYDWTDSGESLYSKALAKMPELFMDNYSLIRAGKAQRLVQDLNSGSIHYANELEKASQLTLDQSMTVRSLLNLLRARTFKGYPSCRFSDSGRNYEVRISITEID